MVKGEKRIKRDLQIIQYYRLWSINQISLNRIAFEIGCCDKTVKAVFNKFRANGEVLDLPRSGRPPKVTQRTRRRVAFEVKNNRKITLGQIKINQNLDICKSTIRNILNDKGFHSMLVKKHLWLPPSSIILRLEFAEEHKNKQVGYWDRVIWSDESNFVYMGTGGKIRIWKKKNENIIPNEFDTAKKFGKFSIGVWGCFDGHGHRALTIYEGRVNTASYIKILQENLIPITKHIVGGHRPIFQQDNAPAHKSKKTLKWLDEMKLIVLDWPTYSPDLNPIENVWGIIKRKLESRVTKIDDKKHLAQLVKKHFFEIELSVLMKLSKSMINRIKEVKKNNGYWIKK